MGIYICAALREMDMTLPQVLEALIFAAPKPLPTADLLAAVQAAGASSENEVAQHYANITEGGVLEALELLQASLEEGGRSFRLMEQAAGWGFVTRGEFAPWVRQLYPDLKPTRLSGPAMETLAIIAYRQPVTRADIEAVRGVAVDGVMQVLLDRSLVRIAGRADLPGRPLLYSTTDYFLEHFGLKSTQDLPNSSELARIPLPKAAVDEERLAKHREKQEREPELPLDLQPTEGSAPGGEGGAEGVDRDGGASGEDLVQSPVAVSESVSPSLEEGSSFAENSGSVSDEASGLAGHAEGQDQNDVSNGGTYDADVSLQGEVSAVREETLPEMPASGGLAPQEQATSSPSVEDSPEDIFPTHS